MKTLKTCLKKCLAQRSGDAKEWDVLVAWVALAYRVTPQESTGFAPYQLLYATDPELPSNVKPQLQGLDYLTEDPGTLSMHLLRRADAVRRACAASGWNQMLAHRRDTLRYVTLHSGAYHPKLRRFEVGDYVYIKRYSASGLSAAPLEWRVRPQVLRVAEVRPSGRVLRLMGKDGSTIDESVANCVPCHLPIVDEAIDSEQFRPDVDHPCAVCRLPDRWQQMVICETCRKGFHIDCLSPPLASVPAGQWACEECTPTGAGGASVPATEVAARRSTTPSHDGRRLKVLRSYENGGEAEVTGVVRALNLDSKKAAYEVEWSDGVREQWSRRQAGQQVRRYAMD